ncbi:OLC1v1005278C1 [Oldenlandia corymbosa var. corymbosa]|uniref:OLC1v1005278C1 n=1 Tax=Oldenlandia corymbosa var. corymbosa TaxID=529605 RepID=A0AAV1DET6_OLDCO|nr:OLC1v1005278C1 [Oldenlandia corymbosa var. corymbosa]
MAKSPSPPPPLTSRRSSIPLYFYVYVVLFLSVILILIVHSFSGGPDCTPHRRPQTFFTRSSRVSTPRFSLVIKVLTYNRLPSLTRCLNSLALAHYDDFTQVHLHIYIDHFPLEYNDGRGSQDLDSKLDLSREILDFVDRFKWDFGDKLVHYRNLNVGLQSQWLEAWWPSSDDEFAFVVEDDLELSPYYFRFLKSLILNYYYNESNFNPMIYGASLQRPRFVPGKHGNKIQLDSGTELFLYQLVGTWGQLLFPRPWKEFRLWYDSHKAKGIKPILDGMVTTGWYKRMGERIWTPWFIKFIHARGYFNIYTNFKNEMALSVSHRDAGVNYGKSAGPDSYLMDENSYNSILELQPLSSLKWYDFCFREVIPHRIIKNFSQLRSVVPSTTKSDTVIIVDLQEVSEMSIRNLVCHFERLAIGNYILLGQKSNLLDDLARRGHPVVDVDQFLLPEMSIKSKGIQESGKKWLKDIMVHAIITRELLQGNHNVLLLDGNMVPLSSDLFYSSSSINDITVGQKNLVFMRSSSDSLKIWDDFINEITSMVDTLENKGSGSLFGNWVSQVGKVLDQKSVKYTKIDELQYGLYIDAIHNNQTNRGEGKKFVFWSPDIDPEAIEKKLIDLGMWAVDSELTCKAVVCHQS